MLSNIMLISATWMIPMSSSTPEVLLDHAIAIQNQRIIDIGPQQTLAARYSSCTQVKLKQHILLPGLVNAHTHAAMNLLRGMADDLPLMEWLSQHIWPAEQRWLSEAWVKTGTQLALAEMIRSGTTCFADMYFYPEVVAQVAEQTGMRACLHSPILEFPSPWANDATNYLDKAASLLATYQGDPLIRVGLGPHAPYTVADETFQKIVRLAEKFDVTIQTHLHETASEVSDGLTQYGQRPIQRLHRLGVLSERLQAVHMTCLTEADIELVAQTKTRVIHCPDSNLKLASGFCPVARLLAAHIPVALGTDGAASNNDLDLMSEMKTAALLAKAVAQDATALPAYQALTMATRMGAQVLGLDHLIGSLDIGKQADIIAVDFSEIHHQPVHQPLSQLVYGSNGQAVSHAWIAGRQVMRDRSLLTLDINSLHQEAQLWTEKMREKNAT